MSELEILIDPELNNIITLTGKQLTFHANKPMDKSIEFTVSDGNLNNTSTIKLIITNKNSESLIMWLWILIIIIVIISC